jgi:hypothetical protein
MTPQRHLAKQGLQLGEYLFDGVEIGTIRGQEQQGCAGRLDGLAYRGLLVEDISSIATVSQNSSVGIRNCSTSHKNKPTLAAPSNTTGATRPFSRKAATNALRDQPSPYHSYPSRMPASAKSAGRKEPGRGFVRGP